LDFGFWILDFGFWILDFGFWIWFWVLGFWGLSIESGNYEALHPGYEGLGAVRITLDDIRAVSTRGRFLLEV
jgi:hypothetical protein